jgi:amino acid permease
VKKIIRRWERIFMKEKLQNLLEVRKIIALLVTVLFVALSLLGTIAPDKVFEIVLMVIAFYFAKSTALDKPQ